jgi:hypothetical protein
MDDAVIAVTARIVYCGAAAFIKAPVADKPVSNDEFNAFDIFS